MGQIQGAGRVSFPLPMTRYRREMRERGYAGGYTAVKRAVRDIRPEPITPFEVRFETPPGEQAQVDLARFEVEFTDEPGVTRIVWLFSMVLGYSRLIWARFIVHQDLQSVLRCHIAALEAIGGVPREILYDRMKTAVIGEDPDGLVIYNRALLDLARHVSWRNSSTSTPIRSHRGKQLEGGAADVFGPGSGNGAAHPVIDVKSLHAKIGELTLENDFLEGALSKAGVVSRVFRTFGLG